MCVCILHRSHHPKKQGHTQRSSTAAQGGHFCLANYYPYFHPPPPPPTLSTATSWAAKSIPSQLSIAALSYAKQVWISLYINSSKMPELNQSPQPSQFNIHRKKATLMKGEGWGDLRFTLTAPAHFVWDAQTFRWFSWGFVVVYNGRGKKNQKALHHLWVGRKINVFGLQMAHIGILIYSVLRCITAQSDISNGVGCAQVNC